MVNTDVHVEVITNRGEVLAARELGPNETSRPSDGRIIPEGQIVSTRRIPVTPKEQNDG